MEQNLSDAIKLLEANGYLIKQKKALTEAKKKQIKSLKNKSEGMKRVEKIWRKTDRFKWNLWQVERYNTACFQKTKEEFFEEIELVEAVSKLQNIGGGKIDGLTYLPKDFSTGLNKWDDVVDRCREVIERKGWPKSVEKRREQVTVYLEPNWEWKKEAEDKYGDMRMNWDELPQWVKKEIIEQRKAG